MNPMSLDDLLKEWQADAPIKETEYALELTRVPKLHSKYASELTANSVALKILNIEYAKIKKQKLDYYNGRMTREQLEAAGLPPFAHNLKYDLPAYLEADPDLIKVDAKRKLYEEAITFCQGVLKELNNRTWQLRSAIEWERFIGGQ